MESSSGRTQGKAIWIQNHLSHPVSEEFSRMQLCCIGITKEIWKSGSHTQEKKKHRKKQNQPHWDIPFIAILSFNEYLGSHEFFVPRGIFFRDRFSYWKSPSYNLFLLQMVKVWMHKLLSCHFKSSGKKQLKRRQIVFLCGVLRVQSILAGKGC